MERKTRNLVLEWEEMGDAKQDGGNALVSP